MQRQRGAGSSGHEIGEGTRVRGPYSGEHRRSDEGARRGRGIGDTLLEGTRTECETNIAERRRDGTLTTSAVPPFERAAAAGHAPGVDGSAGYEVFGDGTERPGAGGVERLGCGGHGSQPAVQTRQLEHLAHGPRQASENQPAVASAARFFQRDQRAQSDA